MRPWSPTGVCGPLAFLAVYCRTSLPPGVFSFRVTLERLQYECLRDNARRLSDEAARQHLRRSGRAAGPRRHRSRKP